MTGLKNTETALQRFFEEPLQRVLLIEGAWGVGKSHFLRNFLKTPKAPIPRFISHCSLFSVKTLAELQETIVSCLEQNEHALPDWARKWPKLAAFGPAPSISALGLKVQIPTAASLVWWIARKIGLVLVLDDLERLPSGMDFQQVLGFVASLTENSVARIILVMNEGALSADRKAALAQFREKVIDVQICFKPSPTEIVDAFLEDTEMREVVLHCFQAVPPNIRVLFRINIALKHARLMLKDKEVQEEMALLQNVVKLEWR